MLGSFNYFSINLEEISTLKSLEAEVVIVPIALVVQTGLKFLLVFLNNLINILSNKCSITT